MGAPSLICFGSVCCTEDNALTRTPVLRRVRSHQSSEGIERRGVRSAITPSTARPCACCCEQLHWLGPAKPTGSVSRESPKVRENRFHLPTTGRFRPPADTDDPNPLAAARQGHLLLLTLNCRWEDRAARQQWREYAIDLLCCPHDSIWMRVMVAGVQAGTRRAVVGVLPRASQWPGVRASHATGVGDYGTYKDASFLVPSAGSQPG